MREGQPEKERGSRRGRQGEKDEGRREKRKRRRENERCSGVLMFLFIYL